MAKLLEWSADEASGDVLDLSGNGRTLTISAGNLTSRVAGHTNTGIQQISTGISVGPAMTGLNTAARTTMFWLRVNSSWTGWIHEYYNVANDTGAWGLLYLSGTLQWRAKNPSNSAFPVTITPDNGVWHHIAATYDGSKMWVYRDGTLLNAGGTTISGGIMTGDTLRFFESVGGSATVDDVRDFDTALTQSEIATQMSTPAGSSSGSTGTIAATFSGVMASFDSTAKASGSIAATFTSLAAALAATSKVTGAVTGAVSGVTATAAGTASAGGALSGSFGSIAAAFAGGAVPASAILDGSLPPVVASFATTATARGAIIGTFAATTFEGAGGIPVVDRDILFTVEPGTRAATLIEVAPPRTVVEENEAPRTEIGAGNMDKQWRKGSKQYVDFVVTLLDPEGELTLSEVEAMPFSVLVGPGLSTPALDDAGWTTPSVPKVSTAAGETFKVAVMHMFQAVAGGVHGVWVKFGPTPEEPVYLAATFTVL